MDQSETGPAIILVTHEYTASGAPGYLLDLLKECPGLFRKFYLIGPPSGSTIGKFEEMPAVRMIRLKSIEWLYAFRDHHLGKLAFLPVRVFINVFLCIRLFLVFRKIDAPGIYLNSIAARYAAIPARISGKKVYWHLHEFGVGGRLAGRTLRYFVASCADVVICNSRATLSWWMSSLPGVEYLMIYNPIPESVHSPVGGIHRFDLVYVGRISEEKGFSHLLLALKILKAGGQTPSLGVLGKFSTDRYRDTVRLMLRSAGMEAQVTFRDEETRSLDMFSSGKVTVVPSLHESFGRVVVESMICGTPVIASRVGGIPEIIRSGRLGLLVEPGNPQMLASGIEQLLLDGELRRSIAAEAKGFVEETFGRGKFREQLRSLFGASSIQHGPGRTGI
ncbi:MAG TPA: glycosyltransferase [Bacteroidota bacterium]|nr:glycosyltransferase [Bacteroidota bacterium]